MNTTRSNNLVRLFLSSLALSVCLLPLAPVQAQAQTSIGIIDLKAVFDGYYRTKQADTQLKERAADFEKARQGMVEDFEAVKDEFDQLRDAANDQALAVAERENRQSEAERKLLELRQIEQDIAQFDNTSKSTLMEQQRRMRDRILEEIKEVAAVKAKEKLYALVIDVAAETINQTPVVLYHNGANSITKEVLAELNARGPVDLPSDGLTPGSGR